MVTEPGREPSGVDRINVCDRYRGVRNLASGLMMMRLALIGMTPVVSWSGALAAAPPGGAVGAAKLLYAVATGLTLTAALHLASYLRCRAHREEIDFEWSLCIGKQPKPRRRAAAPPPEDLDVEKRTDLWRTRLEKESGFLAKSKGAE